MIYDNDVEDELIPQFIIDYFNEKLDSKISNENWFVSFYNKIMMSTSFHRSDDFNSHQYSVKTHYIITNKENLDNHITIKFEGVINSDLLIFKDEIQLSGRELEKFNTKINILKSEKLAALINQNLDINDFVQKKLKL